MGYPSDMWLLLALGALLTGSVVLHEHAKSGTRAAPFLAPATFTGLTRDQVYRVWAKLASGYGKNDAYAALERDLSTRLATMGFSKVMLANEDPTHANVWSFIARWGRDAATGTNVPPLAVYHLEPIADMPPQVTYPAPPPAVLDASLSFAEANAVRTALSRETDPSRLYAFARVLANDFPVSQSLLKAKADILLKPITPASSASFSAIQKAGSVAVTDANVMSAPMAKAALLAYRATLTGAGAGQ